MPEARETTREKRDDGVPIGKPFQKGNPGRPKGSRNKLGEAFLKELHADFEKHGANAIVEVRENKPDQYLKVIASILPKEIDLGENTVSALKESRDASVAAFLRAAADDAESVVVKRLSH